MLEQIEQLLKDMPQGWVSLEQAAAEMEQLGFKTAERSVRRWATDGMVGFKTLPHVGMMLDQAEWEVFKFAYAVTKLGVRGALQVM